MRTPSAKYLYGLTSTFGTSVNITQDEQDAWDAELAAERKAYAAEHLNAAIDAFRKRTRTPSEKAEDPS
jgi:hypothetical protein